MNQLLKKSKLRQFIDDLVFAVIAVLIIRAFLFSTYMVPTGSMLPTIQLKDRFIVSKLTLGLPNPLHDAYFHKKLLFLIPNPFRGSTSKIFTTTHLIPFPGKIKRYDTLVFKSPLQVVEATHIVKNKKGKVLAKTNFYTPYHAGVDYIKRVIGLPGEMLQVIDGVVYINGEPLDEVHTYHRDFNDFGPVVIPKGHYFMMGDNRSNSSDSRVWGFLPKENIVGKAYVRYWPIWRIGLVR